MRFPSPFLLAALAVFAGSRVTSAGAQTTRVVTTVAGLTRSVYGNGGPAAQATINYSDAVALDSAGNLYIADSGDNQIRKISAATGKITAVAGTGQYGYSGDGQLAVNAQLSGPQDVAVDAAGNVYIADFNNSVVRRVTSATGIITTIAGTGQAGYSGDGGAATSAKLFQPTAVALDSAGNIYIGDNDNYIVRKVTAATGIITTVAGTPGQAGNTGEGGLATQAKFSNIKGVVVDSGGDLYISDGSTCLISKVTAATGIINVYAGSGQCSYTGDTGYSSNNGPATNAQFGVNVDKISLDAAGNLYISDYSNSVIRKVAASTGVITTVAGNGSFGFTADGAEALDASLYGAEGVAAAADGSFYFLDRANLRLREVSSAGILSTVAGNGSIGPVPSGVAATSAPLGAEGDPWLSAVYADTVGNFYFADTGNNVVRKVTPAGVISTIAGTGVAGYSGDGGLATNAELQNPAGLAFDSQGNLYIADTQNNLVRKVDAATGIISTYAGTYAQGLAVGQTLSVTGDGGQATSAGLPQPTGLAMDSSGNLYIGEIYQCVVRKVTPAGIISSYAGQANNCFSPAGDGGPATSAKLTIYASGVATDPQGNLYIGDQDTVRKVTASTGIISTVAGVNPYDTNSSSSGPATNTNLSQVYGVSVDAAGNLYIADLSAILVVNTQGIINTVAGQDNTYGYAGDGGLATSALATPVGVGADNSGNIYFVDSIGNRVRKVSTASSTQTAAAEPTFNPAAGNIVLSQPVTLSTSTAGAQIFYTLNGSTPNPGTSALYTAPLTLVGSVKLSAIAIAPGYSTSDTSSASYTVGQASQTISFPALGNVIYGTSPITLDATASSGLAVSYTVTGPATVSGSTLTVTGAGSVTVTATQSGDADYTAAPPVSRSFTVAKASLTVTANSASIVAGQAIPTLGYTITGFVNGDSSSVVSGTTAEKTTATSSSAPGVYPITFSSENLTAANYSFSYVNGTLTIVPSAPVVTLSAASLTFGAQAAGSTSAAQNVTVTNSGNMPLNISSITASANFGETNTCATAVAAGASCMIAVTFTPTSGGALTGTLTIADNAAGAPQTVALNGTGSDVAVTTTATSLTIASAGGSTTANIQIAAVGGFSGSVNLTCSVVYQGTGTAQDPPTCSLNPAQGQVSTGTPLNTVVTVNTTSSGGSAKLENGWMHLGGGAVAALLLFVGVPRRRWRWLGLLALLGVVGLGAGLGCGGGGSKGGGGTPTNPGTTTGSYNVTVTATSGTASMAVTIPLSVE